MWTFPVSFVVCLVAQAAIAWRRARIERRRREAQRRAGNVFFTTGGDR